MRASELLSRLVWRGVPLAAIVWAVRSGAIDYKGYLNMADSLIDVTQTEQRMGALSSMLVQTWAYEPRFPLPGELPGYAQQHVRGYPHPENDSWGREMHLEILAGGFRLRSAGADGLYLTADDVVQIHDKLKKHDLGP